MKDTAERALHRVVSARRSSRTGRDGRSQSICIRLCLPKARSVSKNLPSVGCLTSLGVRAGSGNRFARQLAGLLSKRDGVVGEANDACVSFRKIAHRAQGRVVCSEHMLEFPACNPVQGAPLAEPPSVI